MALAVDTFPVGSLLNGDSYKTSTRMKNISTAMSWIQKQLESLKESDKQLVNLFQKLETDMAEIKQNYYDGSYRGRNSSVSSIRDVYTKSSNSSVTPYDHSHSPLLRTRVTIVEDEVTAILEHSDSNDSLADFADELGGFGDEEEEEEEEGTPFSTGRPSLRSQSSGISSNHDTSLNVRNYNSTHSLHEEEEKKEESSLDHSVRGYTIVTDKGQVRRLSNDSGAVADSDSTGSSVAGENREIKELPKLAGSPLTKLTTDDEKRLSGFADEIFAMFKLGNS